MVILVDQNVAGITGDNEIDPWTKQHEIEEDQKDVGDELRGLRHESPARASQSLKLRTMAQIEQREREVRRGKLCQGGTSSQLVPMLEKNK